MVRMTAPSATAMRTITSDATWKKFTSGRRKRPGFMLPPDSCCLNSWLGLSVRINDLVFHRAMLLQHQRHGAVLVLRKTYRIFNRLAAQFPAYRILELDVREHARRRRSLSGIRGYAQAGERLALLKKNADDVDGGATAQGHQNRFHRTGAMRVRAIGVDRDGV